LDGTVDTLRSSFSIILVTIATIVAGSSKWLGVDIGVGRRRVVERPCVGNRCLNALIYLWILMLDNLRLSGAIRGSVEPSEGKGGESVVAIPMFSMW
jgi:hypothetical protein